MDTIELKYEDLSSEAFTNAVQTLARARLPQAKFAMAVSDMIDEINTARMKITEHYKKEVVAEYAEKDDGGNIKYNEHGGFEVNPEKAEAYEKATQEFGKNKITINRGKLPLNWIASASGLSAIDMNALKKIVDSCEPQQLELPFGGKI